MSRQPMKPPFGSRRRWRSALALTLCALTAARLTSAGDESGKGRPAPAPSLPETIVRFLRLSPGERFRLLEKAGLSEPTTQKVARDVLRMEIVERGTLEA